MRNQNTIFRFRMMKIERRERETFYIFVISIFSPIKFQFNSFRLVCKLIWISWFMPSGWMATTRKLESDHKEINIPLRFVSISCEWYMGSTGWRGSLFTFKNNTNSSLTPTDMDSCHEFKINMGHKLIQVDKVSRKKIFLGFVWMCVCVMDFSTRNPRHETGKAKGKVDVFFGRVSKLIWAFF